MCNQNELLVQPGVYCRQDDQTQVLVSNFSDQEYALLPNVFLGWIKESNGFEEAHINVLDNTAPETLSEREMMEQRSIVESSLKLSENPILQVQPEVKERVIQMFLKHWDAVSVSDADVKTTLGKFSIELVPGAQPVRAKTRPLNPFQEADLKCHIDNLTEGTSTLFLAYLPLPFPGWKIAYPFSIYLIVN